MLPAGFKAAFPSKEQPQMPALDREATGVGLSGIALLVQLIFMLLELRDSMYVRDSVYLQILGKQHSNNYR
jgi:hypothetical protein